VPEVLALDNIPKLFDRNFFVGFFVPSGIMLGLAWLILRAFDRLADWMRFESADKFLDAAIVAAGVWLLAVLLVAINRTLVRTLEGYTFIGWHFLGVRPFPFLERRWQDRFERQAKPVFDHQHEVDIARAAGRQVPKAPPEHATNLRHAVECYPDQARHLLPTAFGNRYRSIEVYSRVVYGLDAIPAWARLQAVLPEPLLERLAEAKAQLDFCVNILLTGLIVIGTYGYLAFTTRSLPEWWLAVLALAAIIFGYRVAGDALHQYGEYVKSAFDLHRGDLADRLGLALPRSPELERAMWTEVSRMMIYRSPAAWDRLTRFRKRGGTEL
jgi:hypothetical protein